MPECSAKQANIQEKIDQWREGGKGIREEPDAGSQAESIPFLPRIVEAVMGT